MKLTHSLLKATLNLTVTIPLVSLINYSSALAALVVSSGNVLINDSNVPAEDARIGFKIPGFGEGILGGSINILPIGQVVQIANTGLSVFDQDIFFIDPTTGDRTTIPVNKPVVIDILFDSKKKNAVKWLRDVYLTGPLGVRLPTRNGLAGFVVQPERNPNPLSPLALSSTPLSYTFTNDGNRELFINSILLGRSPNLIERSNFTTSLLEDINIFDNGGRGWSVLPDEQIELDVPFSLSDGEFLVANVVGTLDPGQTNSFSVNFLQQHQESVPEPSSILSLLALGTLGAASTLKRKLR
nr:PEP-CTERM sorting domain-containing protein [Nostoc parmelioides]